ncbi:MAG TPA: hydroxylamine reductase, partial [Clostridiaceae bacterium]|nr:hydroxylamine reductase [Clostridiaceae bacterium]
MSDMFCFQCQETARNEGCTRVGVCGKKPDVANAQDLLIWNCKGLSAILMALREAGKSVDAYYNHLITGSLFMTITNANFDMEAIEARTAEVLKAKQDCLAQLDSTDNMPEAALWQSSDRDEWHTKSETIGVLSTEDEDVRSLRELITYGLKGLSAYSKHANVLLHDDDNVDLFIQKALAATLDDSLGVPELVDLTLATGEAGVQGMALLDAANTDSYGHPEVTEVSIGVRDNPGILISGHDLRDLEMLLEQTAGTGVDVYTHSEM